MTPELGTEPKHRIQRAQGELAKESRFYFVDDNRCQEIITN